MRISTLAAAAAIGLVSTAAVAQNVNANNLVSVQLSNVDVLNDLARDLDVAVENIPVTVQVPVGIAANVCDVSANVLARAEDDAAPCEATSGSEALTQIVQRSLTEQ